MVVSRKTLCLIYLNWYLLGNFLVRAHFLYQLALRGTNLDEQRDHRSYQGTAICGLNHQIKSLFYFILLFDLPP